MIITINHQKTRYKIVLLTNKKSKDNNNIPKYIKVIRKHKEKK